MARSETACFGNSFNGNKEENKNPVDDSTII